MLRRPGGTRARLPERGLGQCSDRGEARRGVPVAEDTWPPASDPGSRPNLPQIGTPCRLGGGSKGLCCGTSGHSEVLSKGRTRLRGPLVAEAGPTPAQGPGTELPGSPCRPNLSAAVRGKPPTPVRRGDRHRDRLTVPGALTLPSPPLLAGALALRTRARSWGRTLLVGARRLPPPQAASAWNGSAKDPTVAARRGMPVFAGGRAGATVEAEARPCPRRAKTVRGKPDRAQPDHLGLARSNRCQAPVPAVSLPPISRAGQ